MPDDESIYDEAGRRICGARTPNGKHEVCHHDAGFGTDHHGFGRCKRHMGSTPTLNKKAMIQMAMAMGDPIAINPADAIARTIAATAGHVFWLAEKIGSFKFPEVTKLDEDGVETVQGMTPNQRMWFEIYQQERAALVKFSEVAIRAGLATRQIELAEAQGALIAQAIDRVLAGLQLTDHQLNLVPDVVPAVLRGLVVDMPAIEGGQ
jgi:hypothetical protein